MRASLLPLAMVSLLSLLPGCSLQQVALDQTAAILKRSMPAFERDADYELVGAALPANIKMIEGFLEAGPRNPDLLMLAAQACTSYSLVFLEDRYERAEDMSDEAEALKARTVALYMRGHRYGLRLAELTLPGITVALHKNLAALKERLAAAGPEDVPGLFWTAMPLSGAVNLARDDVEMIAWLPEVKALMQRVVELDEGYYHGSAHLVFGSLYGGVGKMLGGDPKLAREHFDKALQITGRKFLLVQVMMARTLAVQLQDRKLFDRLLDEVQKAKLSIDPEQRLANLAAKRRGARLKARADELF